MRDLLAVLFRQRGLVLISFAGIFLAVVLYGLFAPSYEAQMKVLVRRGRVDPVVTPTPTQSPEFQRHEVTEEELNSEVELLRDEHSAHGGTGFGTGFRRRTLVLETCRGERRGTAGSSGAPGKPTVGG